MHKACALPLASREAHVTAALAAMDLYGTPAQMWEVMELALALQGEVLQEAAHGPKRAAAYPATGQPAAKRAMTQPAAGGAHAQYYQQQGYDYSAYYQQQGYYGAQAGA